MLISLHSIVPVRTEPREQAEQSTQLLFAETCDCLETQERWVRIRSHIDAQEGWCDRKMLAPLTEEEARSLPREDTPARVSFPMAYAVSENNHQTIPLSLGTPLPNYKVGTFSLLGVRFQIDPNMVASRPLALDETHLLQVCRFLINTPYLWGGRNALGMDCSGFTQQVMSLFGRHLLRNASEQATQGTGIPLSQRSEIQAGDLCFFDHHDDRISHVGIAIDANRLIHCSGRVKVETLDEEGIYSPEQGVYTHHLVSIRRV